MFDSLGLMSWESFVSSRLPLLDLPEGVINALRQGRIEYTKASAIARIKDSSQRQALLEEAIQENLSLTQIKERIKRQGGNQGLTLHKGILLSLCQWNDNFAAMASLCFQFDTALVMLPMK